MIPVSLFACICNTFKVSDSEDIVLGIVPIRQLFCISNVRSRQKSPRLEGSVWENKLLFKLKYTTEDMQANADGITPINLFLFNCMVAKFVNKPKEDGKVPTKLLEFT